MTTMQGSGFPSVVKPVGTRRPMLTLKRKPPVRRLDEGGSVGSRDVDVAAVDKDFSVDNSGVGGFLGSPEIGGSRGMAGNPNVDSGLVAAQDEMSGERTIGGRLADTLLGERTLSFDPVKGTFTAERDYMGLAGRTAVGMMFGPLGPLVSAGMWAGSRYGEPLDPSRAGHDDRGAGMADGGVPPMPQGGGAPPAGAMPGGGPAAGARGAPQQRGPFRFIPDAQELARRYGRQQERPEPPYSPQGGFLRAAGLVRGPGDGRSDGVEGLADEDGYVIPASEVAAQGNGSTEAGARRIADALGRPDLAEPVERLDGGNVPVRVSDGEMALDRDAVGRAGGHGALDRFVRQTRQRTIRSLKKRPAPRR